PKGDGSVGGEENLHRPPPPGLLRQPPGREAAAGDRLPQAPLPAAIAEEKAAQGENRTRQPAEEEQGGFPARRRAPAGGRPGNRQGREGLPARERAARGRKQIPQAPWGGDCPG